MVGVETGKSPIEPADYDGLQLDTRPGFSDEKAFLSSVEASKIPDLQYSPKSYTSTNGTGKPGAKDISDRSKQRKKRLCGLRRLYFWILLAITLTIIVIAAVIGGVLGSRTNTSPRSASSTTPNTAAPTEVSDVLLGPDMIVDSPIAIAAWSLNGSALSDPASNRIFRMYYQAIDTNIKELNYDGDKAPWKNATVLFTDAVNNTGLAIANYLNGTIQTQSIYYIGGNRYLTEKRRDDHGQYGSPGTLSSLYLQVPDSTGQLPSDSGSVNDPNNTWDQYRLAAAYSTNFHNGPEAHLFYHYQAGNGTRWVQEVIWDQTNDTWSIGAALMDPWPNSHLAAVVDESSKTLRVFYSVGNLTLQESWLNISAPGASYETGVRIPGLLAHDNADLAVVAVDGDLLVYHYVQNGVISIRELNISGTPGSQDDQESYNLTEPIVAQPALVTSDGLSIYQPLGAAVSQVTGLNTTINVFFGNGTVNTTSGYAGLTQVSRSADNNTWPSSYYGHEDGETTLPLGNQVANATGLYYLNADGS